MYKSQADAVRDWLNAYRNCEQSIDEQLERIRELRARIMSIGAQEITDMPKAPTNLNDSLAEYVIRLEELEGRLTTEQAAHERDRQAIIDLLAKLKYEDERRVIRCRYLFGLEWQDVLNYVYGNREDYAEKNASYRRRVYRVHEKAIEDMGRHWSDK